MKHYALILGYAFVAICSAGCSQAEKDHARADAERLRQESKAALHDAKKEVSKASDQLDRDLEKARTKTRKAINDATH